MQSSGLYFPGTPKMAKPRFSFIRTMTVGSGITPDLLTFYKRSARGLSFSYLMISLTAGGEFRPALRTPSL